MRTLLCVLVLVGCGGSDDVPTATYRVSWSLADLGSTTAPTCASYKLADVVVSTTDKMTGDTHMVSVPCTANMAETAPIPLGEHTIKLEAMGTAGDVAGSIDLTGALTKADQPVTLAPAAIRVAAPISKAHSTWMITANGTASSCAATGARGVSVTLTPMGQAPINDIWDCTELQALTDVPYGPFTAQAQLLGVNDVPIGSSIVTNVDAGRGTLLVTMAITAN